MALYSASLLAKCRNTIASETPAATAISFVVVPRNPRWENRRMAIRRICRRRSSPAMRPPFPLAPLFVGVFLLRVGKLQSERFEVSTHLPSVGRQSQVGSTERGHPARIPKAGTDAGESQARMPALQEPLILATARRFSSYGEFG